MNDSNDFGSGEESGGRQVQFDRGAAKDFMSAASAFEDEMVRAGRGATREDLMDASEIYLLGIEFQVEEMVIYANHLILATEGADGEARVEALMVATSDTSAEYMKGYNRSNSGKRSRFRNLMPGGSSENGTAPT